MDIRRLEAFCKVYELGSFSRAAIELYLSQPTISAHVSSLEEELGTMLFDRLGRMILPTQAGRVLYAHSQEAFASLEKARVEIQLLQDKVSGELVIGGSTIPSHYMLPKVIASFSARYPGVQLEMRIGDTAQIIDQVGNGELVLGIVGAQSDRPELTFTPIFDDQLVVVGTPRVVATLEGKDICAWPWIMRERGSGTRKALERALLSSGLDLRCLNTVLTVDSTEAVIQCTLAGLGISVTSRLAAGSYLQREELAEVRVPSLSMERQFYLVRHEKRRLFPASRFFIEFLQRAWPQPGRAARRPER